MTEAEAVEALLDGWVAAWPGLNAGVPYTFDNESFDKAASYAVINIIHTVSRQASMGTIARMERRGYIAVQLFGSVDVGRKVISTLADDVRTVYEKTRFVVGTEAVQTYAGTTNAERADGAWWTCTVTIPFWYQQTR